MEDGRDRCPAEAAVSNLEEFFLSRAFGDFAATRRRLELNGLWVVAAGAQGDLSPSVPLDSRFGSSTFGQLPEEREDFPLDMNKPIATVLAFTPQTPAGRQRALAAIGGIAAAALVVVGVTSGTTHGPGAGENQQALARNGGAHLPPLDAPPCRSGCVERRCRVVGSRTGPRRRARQRRRRRRRNTERDVGCARVVLGLRWCGSGFVAFRWQHAVVRRRVRIRHDVGHDSVARRVESCCDQCSTR